MQSAELVQASLSVWQGAASMHCSHAPELIFGVAAQSVVAHSLLQAVHWHCRTASNAVLPCGDSASQQASQAANVASSAQLGAPALPLEPPVLPASPLVPPVPLASSSESPHPADVLAITASKTM